jgi:intracellular septation protein A
MLENPKKSITESLQILVTKLRNLKGSLTLSLQNNKFLHNKILIAYRGILAYAIALVGTLLSISNLLSKLHSAIIVYKAKHLLETESFFTD